MLKLKKFNKLFRVHKEYRLILYNKSKKGRYETDFINVYRKRLIKNIVERKIWG